MAEPDAGEVTHPPALAALALHGAATASLVPVLLFRRPEIAARLDLLGAVVGETTLLALITLATVLLTTRTRNALPAGALLALSAGLAAVGVALMAWTITIGLFVTGGVLAAVGSGPGLLLHRLLLTSDPSHANRLRTLSWYWSAVAAGAAWPLGLLVLTDISYGSVLWISFVLHLVAALALGPHALLHDEDHAPDHVSRVFDAPWAMRSNWAAFGVAAVIVAGAVPARRILVDEWQRGAEQTAAVLGVVVLAALVVGVFGPWYHRLARLDDGRRADAIGIQLLVAGTAVFVGSVSFTYIGLIVSWAIAGGAAALAVAGLDAATFPAMAPELRRRVAARQYLAAGAGATLGLLLVHVVMGDVDEQLQLAVLGLPLVWIGWAVRRFAASSRDADVEASTASAARVPRRVLGLDGEAVPVLQVDDLDVGYGSVQVLFGVSLRVEPRQVVALLGTNGAGKTTLLRAISGLEPTLSGRVVYSGLDITRTRPTWRVGMGLHQIVGGEAVVGPLTVDENLELFAHLLDRSEREARIAEALEVFPRLGQRREQRAETLSGGEKQMLALAKAIIVQPRLLLIDEFSLGLAPKVIGELLPVVRRIADRGAAVLIVEQSVNIALSIADHAYLIEKGQIGYDGAAEALRSRPELLRSAYLEGLAQALEH